ncbi:MAG: CHAT domain-containing protein [Oxalobacter sp.]|nr:MAG: CHAT domain-containing protein [Oxalobacter sp.]
MLALAARIVACPNAAEAYRSKAPPNKKIMTPRIRIASLFLMLVLALPGQEAFAQRTALPVDDAEQMTRTAVQESLQEKNWARALEHIERLLLRRPNDVWALRQKAECLGALRRPEEAIAVLRRATELAPRDEAAWNDLCWQMIFGKGPLKARPACQRAVSIRKTVSNTANLGHTHMLTAENKLAYRWYRESLQLVKHEEDLNASKGPLTAFKLFIKNGWLTNESRRAGTWMHRQYIAQQDAEAMKQYALSRAKDIDAHPERYLGDQGIKNEAVYRRDNTEVITLLEKALRIVRLQRGHDHPYTLPLLNALAERHVLMQQYRKADALMQHALTLAKKHHGEAHEETMAILESMIGLYKKAKQYQKALPLIAKRIALSIKAHGADHPVTLDTMNRMASLHQQAGYFEDELALRLRILKITEAAYHPAPEALTRIARLYAYTDDAESAARFTQRARTAAKTVETASSGNEIKSDARKALERAWSAQNWSQALRHMETLMAEQPNDDQLFRWKAHFLAQMGQVDASVKAYQHSLKLAPNNPHAWNGLCWQLILSQRLPEARTACERSIALHKNFANTANLGHSFLLTKDAKTAYVHYRESIALLKTQRDLQQGPLNDFDIFIRNKWAREESEKARRWFAQEYAQAEQNATLTARVLTLLKTTPSLHPLLLRHSAQTKADKQFIAHYQAGQYAKAIADIESALSVRQKGKSDAAVSMPSRLNNLAIARHASGAQDKALQTMRRAFSLSVKTNGSTHASTRTIAANLGALYESQEKFGKALGLYQRLLERTDEHIKNDKDYFLLAAKVSWIAHAAGNNEGSMWHDTSLHALTAMETSTPLRAAKMLNHLARYQIQAGDPDKALSQLQRAYDIREKQYGTHHTVSLDTLRALALLQWSMNRTKDAATLFERHIGAVESMCSQSVCPPSPHLKAYKDYAHLLGQGGQSDAAFRLFELSKTRALLNLSASRAGNVSLPASDASALKTLQDQLKALNRQIEKTKNGKRPSLLAQRDQTERDLTAMHLHFSKTSPQYARLTTPALLSANVAVKAIPADTVFVSFLENDGRLLAITATSDQAMRFHDLGKPDDLNKTIAAYRAALAHPRTADAPTPISSWQEQLGRILLQPLKETLNKKRRWIISADDALSQLPFETLQFGNALVVQIHDVTHASSLAHYALLQQRAAEYRQTPRAKTFLGMSRATDGATDEVDVVSRLFDDRDISLYPADQATPAKLQQLNARGKLKHYRYLLLTANDHRFTGMKTHDADWLAFHLQSDLVSLLDHGKETNTDIASRHPASLAHALMTAGNVSTLLNLWRPSERTNSEFLRRFYARLKSGESASKALNAVKREFLTDAQSSHPSHWAAYVLYGI